MVNIENPENQSLSMLLGKSLGNEIIDFTEDTVDTLIENETIKNIPIAGAIIGFIRLGIAIHEKNLLKQTLEFINEFNAGNIDKDKLNEYKEEIKSNPKKAEKKLGRCLIILNSTIEPIHSRMLGHLFKSYVNRSINWDEFVELSDAVHRVFIRDIQHLRKIYEQNAELIEVNEEEAYCNFRLQSLGFLTSLTGIYPSDVKPGIDPNIFVLSEFGKKFIKYTGILDINKVI